MAVTVQFVHLHITEYRPLMLTDTTYFKYAAELGVKL
ncbi:Uncharacterised protein [Klebsiella pneumoniae]|nr:Uncharacterised protein [Klebsiella pneumoniae]